LVGTQVALSFVLLVGSLLFARSLANLAYVDTGFRSKDVFVARVDLRPLGIGGAHSADLAEEIRVRLVAAPGIDAAAVAALVPIDGNKWNDTIWADGRDGDKKIVDFAAVGPGYFETLGIPLVAGRDVDPRDLRGRPAVALVNQAFARAVAGGES